MSSLHALATAPPQRFTRFESDVLDWLRSRVRSPALAQQLERSTLHRRLSRPRLVTLELGVPTTTRLVTDVHGPLEGPHIEAANLEYGAGSMLFLWRGRLARLEMFAYGDVFPAAPSCYSLSPNDLAPPA